SWTVTVALGDLASRHPAAGSFRLYGELYLNEWAGFLSGAGYWAAIAISIGAEMVASATYMAYWFPSVPAIAWVVIASVLLLGVNLLAVGDYGRFEYWFAMIKVVVIIAFIVLGAALLLTGGVAPQYVARGGFFPRVAIGGRHFARDAHDVRHADGRLPRRDCRVDRHHPMGSHRRQRITVRHRVSSRQHSRRWPLDEFRGLDGGVVRRQRGAVLGVAHVVFAG